MHPPRAMLDFPGTGRQAFERPRRILRADLAADVRPALREAAREAGAGAWAVGFVAYEAAPAFDPSLRTPLHSGPAPLLWFGIFDEVSTVAAAPAAPGRTLDWRTSTPREEYDVAIRTIRNAIAAGDVYQVNHTLRFRAPCDADPQALFDALSASRHGRYHALIETAEWAIVSASPELFFDARDGGITTRPMKGTLRRGRWAAEDRAAREALAASPKDRAENLMIVDLLRNDLGRIARFGSVDVPQLFDVETYPTVHQMTSTITAQLREDVTIEDIFAAMFPCGSITGAPKFTAMQSIAALETEPRGAYCGAIGVLRPDGSATFNVGIRTLVVDRAARTAVYGSGGGITWDSSADAEYDEVVAKAALLTEDIPPFDLLETMRCDDGVIHRLDLHMQRLAESAAYWGFPADLAARAREKALQAAERTRARAGETADLAAARSPAGTDVRCGSGHGALRMRLTASRAGAVDITCAALEPDAAAPRPVTLASSPVSSEDRLLFHKTTARALYDAHRAQHPGAFDVLLWNERGEVTEFTIGNVVAELDGELVTPPRACGLLAGCFRKELLCTGSLTERVISTSEIRDASRLWLINSVRGWVPVVLE